jgi:hypothetical protein
MGHYPSEQVLKIIQEWDIIKQGLLPLIDLIKGEWEFADVGYFKKTRRRLYLSTAGWSGNEEIIMALQKKLCILGGMLDERRERRSLHF